MTSLPWKLAHLSDFHVSTFGETFHDRAHFVERSTNPIDASLGKYEIRWEENKWRILCERNNKSKERLKLMLVDPEGYEITVPDGPGKNLMDRMVQYAQHLHARSAKTLSMHLPSVEEAQQLLQDTPSNTNVRLVLAAHTVLAESPDLLVISGDLTDHGDGYVLIETVFADAIKQGRLLAVPGNHDRYLFPFSGNARPKPTRDNKYKAWQAFAQRIGMSLDDTGAWVREFPEASCILVGLDSCATGQSKFLLHSGEIGNAQLNFLRGVARTSGWNNAIHRIVVMHHHLIPLSYGIGKGGPTEIGMRLDDATEVAKVLNQVGVTLVLHGHRHISESRQPAGCNFQILSAPSLTLGCHSGDAPSFWLIELGSRAYWERVRLPLSAYNTRTRREA